MQPPSLPIQHSDAQWALYASTVQPIKPEPTSKSGTARSGDLLLPSLVIIMFVLGTFGAILYKKRQTNSLHQQIRRLEKLWKLESHSPFEEHQ